MDDAFACPRCKTTKYRNPSLVLMVNVCGHALCENCVDLLFVRGSGACPQCQVPLRRSNFRIQIFEDAGVEKEVDIRKRILKDFNKKEESFGSLREYNDYLELIETIVFNLANGIDVEDTKKRIEAYRRENQEQIRKNRTKLSRDEEFLEELILQEEADLRAARAAAANEQLQEKREKQRNKEALIDDLMFSDQSADHILATHRREVSTQQEKVTNAPQERRTMFSTGIRMGKQESIFAPVPKEDVVPVYSYTPLHVDFIGPEAPPREELESLGYLEHMKGATEMDLGGGYFTQLGCHRAIQEAFSGLFFTFDVVRNILNTERTIEDTEMISMS